MNYSRIRAEGEEILPVHTGPEYLLWWNVIVRAIDDIQLYLTGPGKDRLAQKKEDAVSAKKWLCSNSTQPLSFLWCLEQCAVNETVVQWYQKQIRKRADIVL